MIKNHNFSPQLNKNMRISNQLPFNQSDILQIQHLDLNFNNSSYSKKKINKNTTSTTKIKPSTDRVYNSNSQKKSVGNALDLLKSGGLDCNHFDQNNNKTDRETLLQKKKSYAESIRSKNKQLLQNQNHQKLKNKIISYQSINLNGSSRDVFTPPKVKQNSSNLYMTVETEYYSSTKNFQNFSGVFRESNSNNQNLTMNNSLSSNDVLGLKNNKNSSNNVSSKIKNIMNNTIDLNNCYELSGRNNGASTSKKNSINNKQNKLIIPSNPPPLSGKKPNSSAKAGSYAQIFDKKATINALLNHQKSNISSSALNGSIRRLNSLSSSKKQSLKSMFVSSQQDFQFGQHQVSKMQNPNTFVVQQFSQTIQQISQICQVPEDDRIQQQPYNRSHSSNTFTKNLTLNSKIYTQTIDLTQIYKHQKLEEEKEIVILAKQNGTFKKQLATFRKQNSTIKKQLENCKKYIQQLEQKAKKLLEEQELSKTVIQISEPQPSNTFTYPTKQPTSQNGNLQQILQNTQQQLFSLKSENKALELKVYMLQKKLVHEQQLAKKRMALQVNNWKQKYNKLRNQHIRTKNSFINNPFMNSDWSISMQMSRDQ